MKTTIELAREAGCNIKHFSEDPIAVVHHSNGSWVAINDVLDRFAELIRADERAKLLGASVEPAGEVESAAYGCAGFHVRAFDVENQPKLGEKLYTAEALAARVAQAQAEERERIAALFPQPHQEYFGQEIQDAIRARGGKEHA
jgi:hypothetical protein